MTARSDENVDRNVTRAWQRLWQVKEVRFDLDDVDERYLNKTPNILFNELSMLRNIEIINMYAIAANQLPANQLAALKLILQNCTKKISLYSLQLGLSDQDVLSPLVLNNAQEILIDKQCNLVINNCNCSGIKQLLIHNLTFDNSTMNVNRTKTHILLPKLANKFTNVKIFYVSFCEKVDDCVLLLWKSLNNNMSINDMILILNYHYQAN